MQIYSKELLPPITPNHGNVFPFTKHNIEDLRAVPLPFTKFQTINLTSFQRMSDDLTISFWRFPEIPLSFIASISSKYVVCILGACCFRYELTRSAGMFPDKNKSIVCVGQLSRTSIENSRTSIGSVPHRGCKRERKMIQKCKSMVY